MGNIGQTIANLAEQTAFTSLTWGNYVMILIACIFLYLAIAKDFEPLLLTPIAFGMLLVNIFPGIIAKPTTTYLNPNMEEIAIVEFEGEDLEAAWNVCVQSESSTATKYVLKDNAGVDQIVITAGRGADGELKSLEASVAELKAALESKKYTTKENAAGLLYYFYKLDEWAVLPCLIFMGVGAMTDFAPLIANPMSFLLGAAAQFGIYVAYFAAIFLGFTGKQAAAISIIGGADGPTSIFLASKLGQYQLMGPIAVAAYSYMSLVPLIQPPIMRAFTSKKNRKIKMGQLRPVSKLERILFPVIITIVVAMILPTTAPLIGMLMLGNLFRECGVTRQLQETASNALMYIVVILLATSVGATTSAEAFLNVNTLKIVVLGLVAFMFGTFGGVVLGNVMCAASGRKINPLIGSAGVSAVPMAARVSQKVGAQEDPTNFLLMHAMGPNVAGVIGTAVAAGVFMAIYGI
ncbi:MAG: sodium ion-translocating decarboxylase subunit beta [Lachnospiraceae bacterium]|nr:sodium ion-translocating decarboxylase subunit beta [Lachnospiraceae bacterium]MBQ6197456.1 sodium ion-translocating decarboxylase subunit beta [Lachnospiraceae bacterium]